MRLSVLMQVYNEEICLPCALKGLLPVVDELVIIDGGPHGPSTDLTADIIGCFADEFPGKVISMQGTYLRDDGAWDETRQVNDGIARVTGDYMMRTAADIIFDEESVAMIREIIDRFPQMKFFYSPMIDFGGDTNHIILKGHMAVEEILPREIVQADGCVCAMSANPRAVEVGEAKIYGLNIEVDWNREILYMPHVKRFHYGYVKPFEWLVVKYVRLINAKHHARWFELQKAGRAAMLAEAIEWVCNLKKTLPLQPYSGTYPRNGEPLRGMDVMDGYEEFMDTYQERYLGEHSRPNALGWTDRVPTDEEVMDFNEGRMPAEQPALTLDSIGLSKIERFLAESIQHHYESADVLDIGCGSGKMISGLLLGGFIKSGTGVDASKTMVANAIQTATNVGVSAQFIHATMEALNLDRQFDVVIAKDLLEHLYNVNAGLEIITGLLKPEGMLCGSVPFWDTCDCDAHLHHFTAESLKSVLRVFFYDVSASVTDLTGTGENHIKFTARVPKLWGTW